MEFFEITGALFSAAFIIVVGAYIAHWWHDRTKKGGS
jgi:hypothetical protein